MTAERRVAAIVACGIFPLLWLLDATLGQAFARRPHDWPYAIDFHPVWHAARLYLDGHDPYPTAAAVLQSAGPSSQPDLYVYPLPVAAILSPLGAVPYWAAATVFTVLCIAALVLALHALGVRDWRCYGIAFATPATVTAVSWGTLTPLLVLGVALAWRYRDSALRCGAAVALAVVAKLFLWPLVLWLVVTRRFRAAGVAAGLGAALTLGAWAPLGFDGLTTYPARMRDLALVQAPRGETLSALLGTSHALSAATLALLAVAVVVTRRDPRAGFALFVLVAVWTSPIAWIHYFALVFPLIALWSQRLSPAWFVPLGFWAILGQQPHEPWRIAIALLVSALAVATAARARIPEGPGEAVLSGMAVARGRATI